MNDDLFLALLGFVGSAAFLFCAVTVFLRSKMNGELEEDEYAAFAPMPVWPAPQPCPTCAPKPQPSPKPLESVKARLPRMRPIIPMKCPHCHRRTISGNFCDRCGIPLREQEPSSPRINISHGVPSIASMNQPYPNMAATQTTSCTRKDYGEIEMSDKHDEAVSQVVKYLFAMFDDECSRLEKLHKLGTPRWSRFRERKALIQRVTEWSTMIVEGNDLWDAKHSVDVNEVFRQIRKEYALGEYLRK